ncbi:MAG: hypothetical protein ACR2PR_03785 [Pseudohongiellaceae bacterium]
MKKEMFEELLSSTQEMGAIMRNEKTASRITKFPERHPTGPAKALEIPDYDN